MKDLAVHPKGVVWLWLLHILTGHITVTIKYYCLQYSKDVKIIVIENCPFPTKLSYSILIHLIVTSQSVESVQ